MKRISQCMLIALFFPLSIVLFTNSTLASSRVNVTCDREGADVFLDEHLKGECPVEFDVSAGTHIVVLRKDLDDGSYYYYETETRVGEGAIQEIHAILQQRRITQLRSEPLVVSDADAQKVFGLQTQQAWLGPVLRPLDYLQNDFEDRGDVVVDHATGLMWQKSGSEDGLTYQEAQEYVQTLNAQKFAGYTDWRLPTVPELMSLLEPEKVANGRYINPMFDPTQRWCWSADKESAGAVWIAYFDDGHVKWHYFECFGKYVRGVRSSQE